MHHIEARAVRTRVATEFYRDGLDDYLQIDLPRLFAWLRAGLRWILLGALVGLLLGAACGLLTKPRYTVTTDILMDPAGLRIVSDDLFRQNELQRDSQLLNVESKRQTLVSRSVLLRVVAALGLRDDPEFVPPPSFLSSLHWGGSAAGPAQTPDIVALDSLTRRLTARRDEVSFVITMSVWSESAEKAIRISNAILAAFKEELVASDSQGAGRTAEALTSRIDDLRSEVNAAEAAVEVFRRESGLNSSQGELISSRAMSQINDQLVSARQRLIAAQSRYGEMTANNGSDNAAIQSSTMAALRTHYAVLKYQADAEGLTYGPRHPSLAKLQRELGGLQSEIEAEKGRLVEAARNEVEQAKTVVASLESEVSTVSSGVFSDKDAQIRLRELTREAEAKTAVYEAFLVRSREITERQQLDTTNIRVISPPVMPKSRSWPPPTVLLAGFGGIAGLVLGVIATLVFGIVSDLQGSAIRRTMLLPAPGE